MYAVLMEFCTVAALVRCVVWLMEVYILLLNVIKARRKNTKRNRQNLERI